jgi:hypothetical protein
MLDHNIDVALSIQLSKQSTSAVDHDLHITQYAIMNDIEKMNDILPILNNHNILKSIIMESMASLSDKLGNGSIPVAYLYAFIRSNKDLTSGDFNKAYLRYLGLYNYAMKLLKQTNFLGCEFLKN